MEVEPTAPNPPNETPTSTAASTTTNILKKEEAPAPEPLYSVEKILGRKIVNGQKLYLVKWMGYSESQSTWEPVENLLNVIDMIVDYEVKDCLKDGDEQMSQEAASPTTKGKRKATHSLSEEEELVKKVKGSDNCVVASPKENVEKDEEEKEKESMLEKRRLFIQALEAVQGKKFSDHETFTKHASKIKMSQPFVKSNIKDLEKQEIEEEDDPPMFKKKRGRPRKYPRGGEGREQDSSKKKEKTGKENTEENPHPKKRGRPRKTLTNQDEEEEKEKEKKEGEEGEKEGEKEGEEEGKEAEEAGEEKEKEKEKEKEGDEKKEEEQTQTQTQPKKRGRPRKSLTEIVEEKRKRGRPRKVPGGGGDDHKSRDIIEEEGEEGEKEKNEESSEREESKEKQEGEQKEGGEEKEGEEKKEENEKSQDKDKDKEKEKEKEKENEEEQKEMKEEEPRRRLRPRQPQQLVLQESEEEPSSPSEFVKARKETVMKKSKTMMQESRTEETGKRKRGRPRKYADNGNRMETEDKEDKEKEKEKGEEMKQGDEDVIVVKIGDSTMEEKENNSKKEEGSNDEYEGDVSEVENISKERRRGRPRKSEASNEEGSQPKRRGRPRKYPRPEPSNEEEEEQETEEGDSKDGNTEKKREKPKKSTTDGNKENDYKSMFRNEGAAAKTSQTGTTTQNKVLGVHQQQKGDKKESPTKGSGTNNFGSLKEKDVPKKILRARVVTEKGCIFLVEWEKRTNNQQPQNSHVTSHELIAYDPMFLIEYYENTFKNRDKGDDEGGMDCEETAVMMTGENPPEKYGSFANGDKPKEIVAVRAISEKGCEFVVRWQTRADNTEPLDSVVTNEEFKKQDPIFLITFYESKVRMKQGEEGLVMLEFPKQTQTQQQQQEESKGDSGNSNSKQEEELKEVKENREAMQQEEVAQN